ncbi:MAG: HAD-IA family hydrolase [Pseudomonadota bacterium]
MSAIKHVVFDIGQVLLYWNAELIYTDLIPDAAERQAFLATVCSGAWNVEQDRGREWRVAEDMLISDHPDQEELIRAFRPNWHRSIPHAIDGMPEVLASVQQAGYDVTLLTNFNQDTYLEAEELYPFLTSTRGVTVSGRVGLLKPERAIYDCHVAAFDIDPVRTLFIDDSAANVAGAIAAGWDAVQFHDAEQLRISLAERGVNLT